MWWVPSPILSRIIGKFARGTIGISTTPQRRLDLSRARLRATWGINRRKRPCLPAVEHPLTGESHATALTHDNACYDRSRFVYAYRTCT